MPDSTLPTRTRTEVAKPEPKPQAPPPAPVSFKVNKTQGHRDGSHGPEPLKQQHPRQRSEEDENPDSRQDGERDARPSHDDDDDDQSRGRFGTEPMDEDDEADDVVVEDDGLDAMQAMMGFGGFGTTKNKKIAGNNVSGIHKEKKTEYRQYMNRVGGFNRPLSPSR